MLLAMLLAGSCSAAPQTEVVQYPDFPDSLGVAGAFMGVSNGVAIVAGGSNFDKPQWAGGTKRLLNAIWILRKGPDGQWVWIHGGKLPFHVSNGASVTVPQGVVCIGGATEAGETDKVFRLQWNVDKQQVELTHLPALPQACAYMSATIFENRILVAGGKHAGSPDGMDNCWELDLQQHPLVGWQSRGTLPTPRFGAVFAALEDNGKPYLLLASGKNGMDYLTDGYRRALDEPGCNWEPLGAMPRAALVAPTVTVGGAKLVVFGGSDGVNIANRLALRDNYHLNDTILCYDMRTQVWTAIGRMPVGVVATQALPLECGVLLVGGELGNAMRSRKSWWFSILNGLLT